VALIVGLESMGLPLPGETVLVLATIYAATDPSVNVWLVITAAAVGSIIGDNVGYWLGKKYGYALLRRYGRHIGMSDARIKIGQYLFLRHGGKVVFFGRFVALLRILAAVLAGVNRMPWRGFLLANAGGAVNLGRGIRGWRLPLRQSATAIAWRGRTYRFRARDSRTSWRRLFDEALRDSPFRSCRTSATRPPWIRHQGQGIVGKRARLIQQSRDSSEPDQRPIRDAALRSHRTKPSQP
jgi:membrane protein YqaA with SNARE-associated domain